MSAVLKPVGFTPPELSSLVNHRVIEEHASEAAFLWVRRQAGVFAPNFRLDHLKRFDDRLWAHLFALRIAGEAGWRAALARSDPDDAGAIFTLSFLAFDSGQPERMRHALAVALTSPPGTSALVAGLAWLRPATVKPLALRLLQSSVATHRAIGCEALREHGLHDPVTLKAAAIDTDAAVRSSGLRAIGEAGCRTLQAVARHALDDADRRCSFRAAWALAVMGDDIAARHLFNLALQPDWPHARDALELAMRRTDAEWARAAIQRLAIQPHTRRLSLLAAGAFGDPVVVPWLIEQCDDPVLGMAAAEAITTITGADLRQLDLDRDASEPPPLLPADDRGLPTPSTERLRAWWQNNGGPFSRGRRHLAGSPISVPVAAAVLRTGYQRQRAAAALELARLVAPSPLFRINQRADRQLRLLAT